MRQQHGEQNARLIAPACSAPSGVCACWAWQPGQVCRKNYEYARGGGRNRRQTLNRRMPDRGFLKQEVAVWMVEPNANNRPIDWRFTTEDTHLNLHHLYPSFDVRQYAILDYPRNA